MLQFENYSKTFRFAELKREDGILEIRLHSDGGVLQWGIEPHAELSEIFRRVAEDRENRVIILTGTGNAFSGPRADPVGAVESHKMMTSPEAWDRVMFDGRRLEENLLNIEVPVIAALNGPPFRHMEIPLMSDIVLSSETALFEDRAHFTCGNLVPGDSMHLICATLLGWNRARYLQLMGQTLTAAQALEFGLVSEVLPAARVLGRAWEIARGLTSKPTLLLRYTRAVFVHEMKRRMADHLCLGLALEGLAVTQYFADRR
jgi:enoyl-CoA hydratase/carnithine racemase